MSLFSTLRKPVNVSFDEFRIYDGELNTNPICHPIGCPGFFGFYPTTTANGTYDKCPIAPAGNLEGQFRRYRTKQHH